MKVTQVAEEDVQPGDHALHKVGTLDSRPVTRVDREFGQIWLKLPTIEIGPYSIHNYTYTRIEETP